MQTVSQEFHAAAQGSIIPIDAGLRISFTKEIDESTTFFTLNGSMLNGVDVLSPSDDNFLQAWDKYDYQAYDDRIIDVEWSREMAFPFSVQSAMADITLNNYDDYFTPNSSSPIEQYILPKRPIRIFAGYKNANTVQQFVGITQEMPEIDDRSKTVSFHALDFLSEMFTLDITDTINMQDVRTDEVLSVIFQQFGLSETQYSLNKGRNKIPFLYFERGKNAGDIFRQLMQAEMGRLWLDEQGIIRFDQRLAGIQAPVMTFDEHNIIDIKVLNKDNIINTVKITSKVRSVQDFQPIFSNVRRTEDANSVPDASSFTIPANDTAFYPDATLNDPALSATTPTIGQKTDTSWFTAVNLDGDTVASGVAITLSQLKQGSYTMLFNNTNNFPVVIDQVEVWGQPAKVVDVIRYTAYDEESVAKYGERVLGGAEGIENDFFGNRSNCDSFAEYVLDAYKDYSGVIEMPVKGDLSLQLGDIIEVDKGTYTGTYRITYMSNPIKNYAHDQLIRAERYTLREWFQLDTSALNGTAVLAP